MMLDVFLNEARKATLDHRIDWRDPIASFGERAIIAVQPWLTDPALAAFAIRVIERAGEQGQTELAIRVLRAARRIVRPTVRGDVDWALRRLRPVTPAAASRGLASKSGSASRVGDHTCYSAVSRRRAR